jgi:DNA-binding NtrC family response regulator
MALEANTRDKLLRVVSAADDNFLETLFQLLAKDERFREEVLRLSERAQGDDPDSPAQEHLENDIALVGESPQMLGVFCAIRKFAITTLPILITGETGTGKEKAALAIHERWPGTSRPFVTVNCGALPPTLIASELFGHERGAFTGAFQRRIGRLEVAKGGTILLDEIGDIPLELQPHLLRFLEEGTIERVGGNYSIHVNARIVAATNVDLREAVRKGRFRQDLFYRLNVLTIHMPPLRQRGDDIVLLAMLFLRRLAVKMGRPIHGFEGDALDAMLQYAWPGNVRELISRIRRAIIVTEEPWLTRAVLGLDRDDGALSHECSLRHAPCDQAAGSAPDAKSADAGEGVEPHLSPMISLEEAKAQTEERLIRVALEQTSRNITQAALALGVSRITLYRLMEKHGVKSNIAENKRKRRSENPPVRAA